MVTPLCGASGSHPRGGGCQKDAGHAGPHWWAVDGRECPWEDHPTLDETVAYGKGNTGRGEFEVWGEPGVEV